MTNMSNLLMSKCIKKSMRKEIQQIIGDVKIAKIIKCFKILALMLQISNATISIGLRRGINNTNLSSLKTSGVKHVMPTSHSNCKTNSNSKTHTKVFVSSPLNFGLSFKALIAMLLSQTCQNFCWSASQKILFRSLKQINQPKLSELNLISKAGFTLLSFIKTISL